MIIDVVLGIVLIVLCIYYIRFLKFSVDEDRKQSIRLDIISIALRDINDTLLDISRDISRGEED